jgi:hypothetical protein
MQALAASCEELRARTGNPPLDHRVMHQLLCRFQTTLGDYSMFYNCSHPQEVYVEVRTEDFPQLQWLSDLLTIINQGTVLNLVDQVIEATS